VTRPLSEVEILSALKEADQLLERYVAIVTPVAEELARQKSLAVYGREGCYSGDLGCWEEGKDTICLHIKDEARGKSSAGDEPFHGKAIDFNREWGDKATAAGIHHVQISGHF